MFFSICFQNQYLGMEVITVYATDEDVVTYGFQYEGEFVQETPDFEINPFSGVITAKRVFDREEKDLYTVSDSAYSSNEYTEVYRSKL